MYRINTHNRFRPFPFLLDAPEFRSAGHVNLFYVKRGGSIRFSCSFDGVPRPLVEWYFDGMKIGESYSSDFNVTDADRKDGGVYWCKGRNSLGKTDGVNMTLRVRGLVGC